MEIGTVIEVLIAPLKQAIVQLRKCNHNESI